MKNIIWSVCILLVFSLVPLVDLFHSGLPSTHDGQDHVARIANFYQSISEGNMIPRWAGNLNWGYGHPILMFLYPLPSYMASVFKVIGFSLVDSTKLVFGFSYIFSALAMYIWVNSKWGNSAGFVGAMLYFFAPYRFVDLYVRGAIGEHVAFIFPPLILWSLDRLSLNSKHGLMISLAIAGLILSHNAVSLMFMPIVFLYIFYLYYFETKQNRKFLIKCAWFALIGFTLSAFFWIPAFFEGKYTLRDIVTKSEIGDRFALWRSFFSSSWNYGGGNQFTKELGLAHWIGVFFAITLFFRQKSKPIRTMVSGSLLLLFGSLFLMTSASNGIWQTVTLLQKFQFPWRLLTVAVFISSLLGALLVAYLPKKFAIATGFLLIFISIISTSHMWKAKEYFVKPESFYTGTYDGTTDTGESSPIWSVRFMEHRPLLELEIIDGSANIEKIRRTTTTHVYIIKANIKTRLVENTLYFPGWQVLVDGKPTAIEFQDPAWRGLMTFFVEPGEHDIKAVFGDTKLRQFANMMSLAGIVLIGVSLYVKKSDS